MGEAAGWGNNPTKSGYTDTNNIPNEGASLSFAEYDYKNTNTQNTTQITKQTHDTIIYKELLEADILSLVKAIGSFSRARNRHMTQ